MPLQLVVSKPLQETARPAAHYGWLVGIAAAIAVLHMATNGRYGFHRDELQFLSDARHLDWGFVSYPPFTPVIERISLMLFGPSMVGLRFFSVLAQAVAIVMSGLMARELGGEVRAQAATALAVALSPLPLFEGTEFQYSSFDYLWWVLAAYFVIRLLNRDDPRWWLAIGAVLGVGSQTKYAIAFLVAGFLAGMLLSPARRWFASRWFWAGVAVALLIATPNLIWLARHDWISIRFLQHIHARDVRNGRAEGFWLDQLKINVNVFAAPLCVTGVIAALRSPRHRLLAWMYLVPLALFALGKGRGYYVAAAYPMTIALGAVPAERWVNGLGTITRRTLQTVFVAGTLALGALYCAVLIPLATGGPLRDFCLRINGDMREEFGWPELVGKIAASRDTLPAGQQQSFGVLVGNYGEQGAVELYGPAYHLPPPISRTNSAWLRGYPTPPPTTLIVVGFRESEMDRAFTGCRVVAHNDSGGIHNEESEYNPDIWLCGPPRDGWAKFWEEYQAFG